MNYLFLDVLLTINLKYIDLFNAEKFFNFLYLLFSLIFKIILKRYFYICVEKKFLIFFF
jgi:hypothetical protein